MGQAWCDKSSLSGRQVTEAALFGNRMADITNCDDVIRFEGC